MVSTALLHTELSDPSQPRESETGTFTASVVGRGNCDKGKSVQWAVSVQVRSPPLAHVQSLGSLPCPVLVWRGHQGEVSGW